MTPYDFSYVLLRFGEVAQRAADAFRELGLLLVQEDDDE